jgi:hypothetical protein
MRNAYLLGLVIDAHRYFHDRYPIPVSYRKDFHFVLKPPGSDLEVEYLGQRIDPKTTLRVTQLRSP